jgi:hypothetical protein
MEDFRRVLATCREENIGLTLAINPVHALDLELVRAAGGWERFEQWKRETVRIIAEEQMEGRAVLWDFSGYSGPTMEEVPPAGDGTTRMKYYFENSHYTPELGRLMLDRMFSGRNDFGVIVARSNIEGHLENVRQAREHYAQSHPTDVSWVQRVAKQVLAARNLAGSGLDVE